MTSFMEFMLFEARISWARTLKVEAYLPLAALNLTTEIFHRQKLAASITSEELRGNINELDTAMCLRLDNSQWQP